MHDFRSQAQALRETMVARRRDFHRHPELGFQEVRTAGIVAQTLVGLGLEVQTGIGKTGVVGLLQGEKDGPTVMVRCDMDALPIQEENQTDYRSQTPQTMHACGHDGHTAIALAVAEMLSQRRANIAGRVKFVFQPAEEIGEGALAMMKDGVLANPAPEVAVGLHLWNELPIGEVAVTSGPFMAGADSFEIEIRGRGGHGAMPHLSIDPVVTMAQVILALQTIVSRNVPPIDTAVISITRVQGGDVFNVIPQKATLGGTIRAFKKDIHRLVVERLHAVAEQTAKAMGCEASVATKSLSLPVINDAQVAARLKARFARAIPELTYHDHVMTMAAEDMAFFLEKVPGVYFFVGSANPTCDLAYPHHHPRFDIDEEALVNGAALLASAVAEYVLPE